MSVTTTNQAQIMESVLADGDLAKLSAEQRVAYYFQVCESLGLNPYTRPFDYITLNGKRVLYPKRDCTDQLRRLRNITLTVTDKHIEDDLFIVTVRATDGAGRSDEDFGAVTIGALKGEARANAMLKAITKAKRRVTLSICGMGMNDESELEPLPGAVIENIELPPAPEKPRAATASTPRPQTRSASDEDAKWKAFSGKVYQALTEAGSRAEVEAIAARQSVADAVASGPAWVRRDLSEMLADAYGKFPEADADAANEPESAAA